jgi:hypothetical protein
MQGGLGNQLFQYFAGATLASKFGLPLILELGDLSFAKTPRKFELRDLALPYEYRTVSNRRLCAFARVKNFAARFSISLGGRTFVSREVGFDALLENSCSIEKIKGYFQSWRYVQPFQNQLDIFVATSWTNQMMLKAAEAHPIIMHIRRGDYLEGNESIGVLSTDYFKSALDSLSNSGITGRVWVFTDSPELIDSIFLDEIDGEIVSTPTIATPAEILSVMSLGRGTIISNSTFSWWAAYLNQSGVVIAPDKWFQFEQDPKDLCPENWIRVKSIWQ